MMSIPGDLRFSADHEWIRVEQGRLRVGITAYAQESLGDVVFVKLPDVGTVVAAAEPFGEVESTKSVSDLFAPVAGRVVEVNVSLETSPEQVNSDPYGAGWLCVIEPSDLAEVEGLLSADQYQAMIEG